MSRWDIGNRLHTSLYAKSRNIAKTVYKQTSLFKLGIDDYTFHYIVNVGNGSMGSRFG